MSFRIPSRVGRALFACFVAAGLFAASAREAHADVGKAVIALDGDVVIPAGMDRSGAGLGIGGRFGYRIDVGLAALTPEIGGSYAAFGGDRNPGVWRGFAGGRLAVGALVRPSVFAHVGYGGASFEPVGAYATKVSGLAADGGLALDFTALPLLDVGVHGAYNVVGVGDAGDPASWVSLGAHVAFVF